MKRITLPIYFTVLGLLMLSAGLIARHYVPGESDFWQGFPMGCAIGLLVLGLISKRKKNRQHHSSTSTPNTI